MAYEDQRNLASDDEYPAFKELPVTSGTTDGRVYQGAAWLIVVGVFAFVGWAAQVEAVLRHDPAVMGRPFFWVDALLFTAHLALFGMGLLACRQGDGLRAMKYAVGVFGLLILAMSLALAFPRPIA
jgi:hypothetical protein